MTKDELAKLLDEKLANVATKKDLQAMERRVNRKFDQLFNALDRDVMENRRRLSRVEEQLGLVA